MNDVKRFLWPMIFAIPALAAGVAIGHYTSFTPAVAPTPATATSSGPVIASTPIAQTPIAISQPDVPETEAADSSGENLIARIKSALGRPGNRRTYATFSKLADSI